ncbi:hypothetical protein [Novosphingobium sp.]|uniref:hypothetical protein n=1 Tax=Novosphingobium sp. TaxID=1874826 RepID=UPI0026021A86|nr:hypothetical protein [Novosphingobium sp.]
MRRSTRDNDPGGIGKAHHLSHTAARVERRIGCRCHVGGSNPGRYILKRCLVRHFPASEHDIVRSAGSMRMRQARLSSRKFSLSSRSLAIMPRMAVAKLRHADMSDAAMPMYPKAVIMARDTPFRSALGSSPFSKCKPWAGSLSSLDLKQTTTSR